MQLTRGESVGDTARVLSRYVDAIVIRSGSHELVAELAEGADVPVVNALTPEHHPCQAIADVHDARRALRRRLEAGASPTSATATTSPARWRSSARPPASRSRSLRPRATSSSEAYGAQLTGDPAEAVAGANAVYADVWVSMGDDETADARRAALEPYRVDDALLAGAADGAIAMHCLPAHPGEEITAEVLYGERSAVWDQAENRLHAQKALLELLLG